MGLRFRSGAFRRRLTSVLLSSLIFPAAIGSARAAEEASPPVSRAVVLKLMKDARAGGAYLDASEAVITALAAEKPQTMIVEFHAREASEISPPLADEHAAKKSELLNAISGVRRQRDYSHLPMMALEVGNGSALLALTRNPNVKAVYENKRAKTFLTESLPLINQPAAVAGGYTGADYSVAVLDSGLDYTHSAFGSCTAPGVPAATCRVPYVQDFAPEDGLRDDDVKHGTNVAGIVAGVAPGAKVIGLDVFDGENASWSDIIDAINWVIANRSTYGIRALNMSLGYSGTAWNDYCSNSALNTPITNAKSAGVLVAVASGNDDWSNGVAEPACVANAVTVGAVYDSNLGAMNWGTCSDPTTSADRVTCFSNSGAPLDMLAPGSVITAAGVLMSGTSQATPHVAGAAAVVASAHPTYTAQQVEDELESNGVSITDYRNMLARPRLDIAYLTAPQSTPDLVVTAVQAPVYSSGSVTVSATVKNQGNVRASLSTVWFYLSTDEAITSADTYLGACGVSSLAVGASASCSVSKSIPASVTAGNYYIGAVADGPKSVSEANENNNTLVASGKIAIYGDLLEVSHYGPGAITSAPAGINCGTDCSEYYFNQRVTLTATPAAGYRLVGWSGACTGTSSSCEVYVGSATSVTATFAAPVSADLNSDGKGDLLWYNAGTGRTDAWLMNGLTRSSTRTLLTNLAWAPVAKGDFDGDGKLDILWNNASTGQTNVWFMDGMIMKSGASLLTNTAWKPIMAGDLNGDGTSDIIWYNASNGAIDAWLMSGGKMASMGRLFTHIQWKVAAIGDLNGDGKADLLWHNATTGQTDAWLMNGLTASSSKWLLTNTAWIPMAAGDIDGDTKADIIWNNPTTGQSEYWLMNGVTRTSSGRLFTSTAWRPIGTVDLNGDGKSDLIWYNSALGRTDAWLMNGGTPAAITTLLTTPPGWRVVTP